MARASTRSLRLRSTHPRIHDADTLPPLADRPRHRTAVAPRVPHAARAALVGVFGALLVLFGLTLPAFDAGFVQARLAPVLLVAQPDISSARLVNEPELATGLVRASHPLGRPRADQPVAPRLRSLPRVGEVSPIQLAAALVHDGLATAEQPRSRILAARTVLLGAAALALGATLIVLLALGRRLRALNRVQTALQGAFGFVAMAVCGLLVLAWLLDEAVRQQLVLDGFAVVGAGAAMTWLAAVASLRWRTALSSLALGCLLLGTTGVAGYLLATWS